MIGEDSGVRVYLYGDGGGADIKRSGSCSGCYRDSSSDRDASQGVCVRGGFDPAEHIGAVSRGAAAVSADPGWLSHDQSADCDSDYDSLRSAGRRRSVLLAGSGKGLSGLDGYGALLRALMSSQGS